MATKKTAPAPAPDLFREPPDALVKALRELKAQLGLRQRHRREGGEGVTVTEHQLPDGFPVTCGPLWLELRDRKVSGPTDTRPENRGDVVLEHLVVYDTRRGNRGPVFEYFDGKVRVDLDADLVSPTADFLRRVTATMKRKPRKKAEPQPATVERRAHQGGANVVYINLPPDMARDTPPRPPTPS